MQQRQLTKLIPNLMLFPTDHRLRKTPLAKAGQPQATHTRPAMNTGSVMSALPAKTDRPAVNAGSVMTFLPVILLLMLLFAAASCMELIYPEPDEVPVDNPADINNPNFMSPTLEVFRKQINEDGQVRVGWFGGPPSIRPNLEYRYSIPGVVNSDWHPNNLEMERNLATGDYTMVISVRYQHYPEESRTRTDVTIDLPVRVRPTDPHITLFPEIPIETATGQEFDMTAGVWLADDLMAASIIVEYNPQYFELRNASFSDDNIFRKQDRQTVRLIHRDDASGIVEFAEALSENQHLGVSGNGEIGTVRLRVRTGTPPGNYTVRIGAGSELRTAANQSITTGKDERTIHVR